MVDYRVMKFRKTLAGAGLVLATLTMQQAMHAQTFNDLADNSKPVAVDPADVVNRKLGDAIEHRYHKDSAALHGVVLAAHKVYLVPTAEGIRIVAANPDNSLPLVPETNGPARRAIQYDVHLDQVGAEDPGVLHYVQDRGPITPVGTSVVVNTHRLPDGFGCRVYGTPNPNPVAYYNATIPTGGYQQHVTGWRQYIHYMSPEEERAWSSQMNPEVGLFQSPKPFLTH